MHESKRVNRYAMLETPPAIDLELVRLRVPASTAASRLSFAYLDPLAREIANLIVATRSGAER